jgi:hypothetical protein
MTATAPIRSPVVIRRRIAGETLLVPVRGHLADLMSIYAVNRVAEFIWDHLDGSASIEALAGAVTDAFDVPLATARADVEAFIGSLQATGLLAEAD